MIPGLPVEHTIAPAVGAPDTEDILVGGILATHILLAVIATKAGEDTQGLAVTDFTVSDGKIVGATLDTDGWALTVIYTSPGGY